MPGWCCILIAMLPAIAAAQGCPPDLCPEGCEDCPLDCDEWEGGVTVGPLPHQKLPSPAPCLVTGVDENGQPYAYFGPNCATLTDLLP